MLGNRIRQLRENNNMGLNETAELAGISGSYLSNIEKGIKKNPSMKALEKIATALGVSVNDFFDSEKEYTSTDIAELGTYSTQLSKDETKLLKNYNKLNDLGKNKVIDYTKDLSDNIKYRKENNIIELNTIVKEESKTLEEIYTTNAAHNDDLTEDENSEADKRILDRLKKR